MTTVFGCWDDIWMMGRSGIILISFISQHHPSIGNHIQATKSVRSTKYFLWVSATVRPDIDMDLDFITSQVMRQMRQFEINEANMANHHNSVKLLPFVAKHYYQQENLILFNFSLPAHQVSPTSIIVR